MPSYLLSYSLQSRSRESVPYMDALAQYWALYTLTKLLLTNLIVQYQLGVSSTHTYWGKEPPLALKSYSL